MGKTKQKPTEPHCPELDRMKEVRGKSQAIGEFLDWLAQEKGWHLCKEHDHTDACYRPHEHGVDMCHVFGGECEKERELACGARIGEYLSVAYNTEKLLAEFYDIDLNKVEDERRAILQYMEDRRNYAEEADDADL